MNCKNKLEQLGAKFVPINMRELTLVLPNVNYSIETTDEYPSMVKSINFNGNEVKVGDKFEINASNSVVNYKVNIIKIDKQNKCRIILCESNYNTSTMFVLPLLFNEKHECSYIRNNVGYLMNCFVECKFIEPKSRYSIFLLFKFSKFEEFKIREDNIFNHKQFVKKHDVNERYVVYEFEIPDKFKYDYDLIIDGQYSKVDKVVKNKSYYFHENSIETSIMRKVFERDVDLASHYARRFGVDISVFNEVELYNKINNDDVLIMDYIL